MNRTDIMWTKIATAIIPKLIVDAYDYDCWGYPLAYRSYEPVNQRYKFTGKERDKESAVDGNGYDYFGARYYDAHIANWLSIDPLMEKHFDYTPYNYVLRSPLVLIDPQGKQVDYQMHMTQGYETGYATENIYYKWGSTGEYRTEPEGGNVSTDVGLLDPVDIAAVVFTGGSYLGMKSSLKAGVELTEKILTREVTQELAESVGKLTIKEAGELVTKEGLNIGIHATQRMAENKITTKMVETVLKKGTRFWDPKNKAMSYVLEKGFTSGKDLLVGKSLTGKITTVFPGKNLIKSRFIPF